MRWMETKDERRGKNRVKEKRLTIMRKKKSTKKKMESEK